MLRYRSWQQVKALLTGTSTMEMRKPGQPANASSAGKAKTRRRLSAEAREKIAAAKGLVGRMRKAAKKAARAPLQFTSKGAAAVGLHAKKEAHLEGGSA